MAENTNLSAQFVRFQTEKKPEWQPSLIAEFEFAPEKAAPNLPGPNPGDLIMISRQGQASTVMVSLGNPEKFSLEIVRQASGRLGRWVTGSGAEELAVNLDSLQAAASAASYSTSLHDLAEAVMTGMDLGSYHFDQYKHHDTEHTVVTVVMMSEGQPYIDPKLVQRVIAITNTVNMARNLAHEPANVINPVTLSLKAQEIADRLGLKITILDEAALAAMGAGAILAVGQGSQTPPRMIILQYPGQKPSTQPVALVGKAITFDTGGYSIKSTEGIVGMKYDKCGGVDVLAVMQAAAELNLVVPLVGVICAAENMISGQSYRPDDIITSLSGKTVEIISTDAEGRLVLADGLTYVQREYQPRAIIDLATLTGGVVTALGRVRAGMMSNNDELASDLFSAGEATGERLWRLPLDDEYSRNMKGEDADLKNSGGREGHAILGGAFLKAFIEDDIPWAHLDIAGVADTNKDLAYAPKGPTGFGIRLLIQYLKNLS